MNFTVTYDPAANAGYIYLQHISPGGVRKTVEAIPEAILLDFDNEGHLIGIEVLNANRLLPREVWKGAEPVRLPE
ncbi:hypothetical protein B7486_19255 [cyanobacterium TDX16]|nr:hypothetical protein B7486_19255 [cyanobacterium TDX16]